MDKVFSGIQPSGQLHLGNYLGAVQKWVQLLEDHDCIYCIVDYHAVTQDYEPKELKGRIFEMAAGLLACGIDPDKCRLFVQSHVPEHTELAWVLHTVTPMGELERQVQYKSKSENQPENINVGLFSYPVLQAADILLYRADKVPVGEDQVQHLELAREIVRKFKSRYGYEFPEPKPVLSDVKRLKGLDGDDKMSKSLGNTIGIDEDEESITAKIKKAKTDPQRKKRKDPGDPEICNIYTLHKFFSSEKTQKWAADGCKSADIGCGDCKEKLTKRIVGHLAPIQERLQELRAAPDKVWDILHQGAVACRREAATNLDAVRQAMGLR
ncbi:MAG: tryptophan--tRNA ligase [bacterium]